MGNSARGDQTYELRFTNSNGYSPRVIGPGGLGLGYSAQIPTWQISGKHILLELGPSGNKDYYPLNRARVRVDLGPDFVFEDGSRTVTADVSPDHPLRRYLDAVPNPDCKAAAEAWKRWHENPNQPPSNTALSSPPPSPGCIAFGDEITRAANAYGIDPFYLAALAAQETGGPQSDSGRNTPIGSDGHGRGLFQIDDRWHHDISLSDLSDPAKNAMYAAHMVRDLLKANGGDEHAAAAQYNTGDPEECGSKSIWPSGRLCYADSVSAHQKRLKANTKQIQSCSKGVSQ